MAPNNQGLHLPTFRSIFQKVPSVIIFSFLFFTFSATPTSYFPGPDNTRRIKNYSDITNSVKNINKLIETGSKKIAFLNQFMTASSTQRKTIKLVERPS